MNTIDKFRAYIERLAKSIDNATGDFAEGRRLEQRIILSFLDTLEEPDKDLEEEVKRYYSDNLEYISSDQPTLSILTNIARHFAEWGAEHSGYPETPNDLEEAAEKHLDTMFGRGKHQPFYKELFIAGAKWQKAKMMEEAVEEPDFPGFEEDKDMVVGRDYVPVDWVETLDLYGRWKIIPMRDAVEGEVIKTNKHTSVRYKSYYGTDRYFYGIADKQFKAGDKVRIVILPKEDGE